MATRKTKAAGKRQSGPALTRQRHRERGEEQLAVWLPADLVAAVREMADRQGTSTTQLVGLLLMRAVTEAAIRSGTDLPA